MDSEFISLLLGPLGLLVGLIVTVAALALGRYVVPRWTLDASLAREKRVEEENSTLNESVIRLIKENAEFKATVAALKAQVEDLRREVQELRRQ